MRPLCHESAPEDDSGGKARAVGPKKLARGLQPHEDTMCICFANGGEMSALDKGVRSQGSGSAADAFFYSFCWSH